MSKCAKCGACSTVCPIYRQTGNEAHTARGKIHLLQELDPRRASPALHELLDKCLLCGACRATCPNRIDIPALVMAARQELPPRFRLKSFEKYLLTKLLAHPGLLGGIGFLARRLPPESGLRYKLALLDDDLARPAPAKAEIAKLCPSAEAFYFRGCLASHLKPEIATATVHLTAQLRQTALLPLSGETCCGLAAEAAGNAVSAKELAKKNIVAATQGEDPAHPRPILTSCASCFAQLREYPRLLGDDPEWRGPALAFASRVVELASFLGVTGTSAATSPAQTGEPRLSVLYHDPCHLRFPATVPGLAAPGELLAPPRKLLRQIPHLTLLEFPDGPSCCGQGGLFSLGQPELAQEIAAPLLAACQKLHPDLLLTSCSGCLLQWRQGLRSLHSPTQAEHLAVFLAARLQTPLAPDNNP